MAIPEAFKGDYTRASTNFKSHDLESFDLQVDARSITGYPISRDGNLSTTFYYKFLKECNFYANNYSSGPMPYDTFAHHNFIIVENLRRKKITNGQLTVHLKFKRILNHKLYLISMPVHKKNLSFDEYYTPEITEGKISSSNDVDMFDE